jgi:hypothetical protein
MASGGSGPGGGPGGGGSGAPADATYILIAPTAFLPNARSLTAGTGISLIDGGPGGAITIMATGTDASAWHKTGDVIGADKILGSLDDFAVRLFANNQEYGRIVDNGPNIHWTGPRLLVGATTPFYPNADIAHFNKDLDDQLTITLQNPNAGAAGASIVCINDLGHTGGENILGSGWPSGTDGVLSDETAFLGFGTSVVLGTQTAKPVRFNVANVEWGRFAADGSFLIGAVAGSGVETAIFRRDVNSQSLIQIQNATNGTLAAALAYFVAAGAPGQCRVGQTSSDFTPTSGFGNVAASEAFVQGNFVPLYVGTVSTDPIRFVTDAVERAQFLSTGEFVPTADATGSVGTNARRWSLIRGVTITSGDLELENSDASAKWTIREAKPDDDTEDPRKLYVIDRVVGKKYILPLQAA